MILTIRTDKPDAEIGLYHTSGKQIAYKKWEAHRQLSSTLLTVFENFLSEAGVTSQEVVAVVFYKGPGSFTGLRIGASFVNALQVPVVNESGKSWQDDGIKRLNIGDSETAIPFYGSEPYTTVQKK